MKKKLHLRVPVSSDQEILIKQKAQAAGLSVAAYLRNIGVGYQVPSAIDNRNVDKLLKINGDLGRLGGLLKMWLTNNVKTKITSKADIENTLGNIQETQNAMLNAIIELKNKQA